MLTLRKMASRASDDFCDPQYGWFNDAGELEAEAGSDEINAWADAGEPQGWQKPMILVEAIRPQPRYFTDRDKAFAAHYTEGGTLWKRKASAPSSVKPWANGEIQNSRKDWYEPFMIDGRKP